MRCRLVPEVSPISSSHPHPGASDDRGAARRPRTGTGVRFPCNPRAQEETRRRQPPVGPPTSTARSVAPMPRRTSGRRACRTPQARPRSACQRRSLPSCGRGAAPSRPLGATQVDCHRQGVGVGAMVASSGVLMLSRASGVHSRKIAGVRWHASRPGDRGAALVRRSRGPSPGTAARRVARPTPTARSLGSMVMVPDACRGSLARP